MAFVDRVDELQWLNEGWGTGRPELRILYGRRRVGKSRLLDEFTADKRTVVYQAVEGTTTDQLRDLTAAILQVDDDPVLRAAPLANWDAALAKLTQMAHSAPMVVIFDEYQYAAEADPTMASRLQRWCSRDAANVPIYLVLCGSYVRFFEKNVLNGPAYGRFTGTRQLFPLSYRDAAAFFPNWSVEDRIRAYAITGGIPHYLLQLDPARSLAWNIARRVLSPGAVLYQEAELVVREELREPRVYFSILRAIDDGCTTNGRIEERVQGPGAKTHLTAYLKTLADLGLVRQRGPLVGGVRRSIWELAEPYLRFWFRFVLPHKSSLDHGADPDRFYKEIVAPALDHFVSRPGFEEICRAWTEREIGHGRLVSGMPSVGSWWGPVPDPQPGNPRHQKEGEIEVVAAKGKQLVLAGEAKWTNSAVDLAVLSHLQQTVQHVPGADEQTQLVLFGRSFDDRLRKVAPTENVLLVDPSDLYA
jgi:AAA+ ATPase superfamily predicted ATPase